MGDRLRKARDYAHLDQDDLAEELGVSRQAVSKWENGAPDKAPIKRAFVQVWALRCGVPFDWLWGGDTDIARQLGLACPEGPAWTSALANC